MIYSYTHRPGPHIAVDSPKKFKIFDFKCNRLIRVHTNAVRVRMLMSRFSRSNLTAMCGPGHIANKYMYSSLVNLSIEVIAIIF